MLPLLKVCMLVIWVWTHWFCKHPFRSCACWNVDEFWSILMECECVCGCARVHVKYIWQKKYKHILVLIAIVQQAVIAAFARWRLCWLTNVIRWLRARLVGLIMVQSEGNRSNLSINRKDPSTLWISVLSPFDSIRMHDFLKAIQTFTDWKVLKRLLIWPWAAKEFSIADFTRR